MAAARTRSPASETAPVGRPTHIQPRQAADRKHSTVTMYPSMPLSPAEKTRATIRTPPRNCICTFILYYIAGDSAMQNGK